MQVGDRIRDIEDGDCYFEGIITEIINKTFKYKVDTVIWNGENYLDDKYIGKEIEPIWWYIKKII
jgi:hypothetical protein